jgi:aconitate hydratase
VYLAPPETAAAAAAFGKITDPRKLGEYPKVSNPEKYLTDDGSLLFPPEDASAVEIIMGPNIKPLPCFEAAPDDLEAVVVLKLEDNITTDHIMPAGAKILPLRSNIQAMSEFVFVNVDEGFPARCRQAKNAVIVAGENYGQGSSREHAAIVPRFLGVRAKIAKSFARIHRANLINFGVLPLTFVNPEDYDAVTQGDTVAIPGLRSALSEGRSEILAHVGGKPIKLRMDFTERDRRALLAGGLINTAADLGRDAVCF